MAVTTRRCHGCATFYDTKLRACPNCETAKHPFNVGLRAQQWATALNSKAQWAKENC